MKILFLAPQPFYQERGTPIAVDLMVKTICERGYSVDLVCYGEGEDRHYEGLRIFRTPDLPFIRKVGIGFSWKKICCDLLMAARAFGLCASNRYQVIHAVEESVFIAMALKLFFRIPYIYDMDSSLADSMMAKFTGLRRVEKMLRGCERAAVRSAAAVGAVCESLAVLAENYGAAKVKLIPDVSLVEGHGENSKNYFKDDSKPVFLYAGNLETYQGIELMLQAFALVCDKDSSATLAIVGGSPNDIEASAKRIQGTTAEGRVRWLGAMPLSELGNLLTQADILLSPRMSGSNTPMKIYSYLAAGKPIVATRIGSHTQVLDESIAVLCDPVPQRMAQAMLYLINDPALGHQLGEAARERCSQKHTLDSFKKNVSDLYAVLTAAQEMPAKECNREISQKKEVIKSET